VEGTDCQSPCPLRAGTRWTDPLCAPARQSSLPAGFGVLGLPCRCATKRGGIGARCCQSHATTATTATRHHAGQGRRRRDVRPDLAVVLHLHQPGQRPAPRGRSRGLAQPHARTMLAQWSRGFRARALPCLVRRTRMRLAPLPAAPALLGATTWARRRKRTPRAHCGGPLPGATAVLTPAGRCRGGARATRTQSTTLMNKAIFLEWGYPTCLALWH